MQPWYTKAEAFFRLEPFFPYATAPWFYIFGMQPWYTKAEAFFRLEPFFPYATAPARYSGPSFCLGGQRPPIPFQRRPFPSMRFPGFFFPASQIPISGSQVFPPAKLNHSRTAGVRTVTSTSARLTESGCCPNSRGIDLKLSMQTLPPLHLSELLEN